MAWELRNGKRVYYRSRRKGKQVERDYFGEGDRARLAAALDDEKRRQERQESETIAALRQQWLDGCKPLDQLTAGTQALVHATLVAAAIKTRSRKGGGTMTASQDPLLAELLALVAEADAGDTSVLPEVQRLLSDQPQLVDHFGDIARVAADLWLALYVQDDVLIAEATRKKMLAWRASIAGPQPSPLESLLTEQIVVCWLQSHYAEVMHAQALTLQASKAVLRECLSRQKESQHGLATSIRRLAKLRKLLPSLEPMAVRLQFPVVSAEDDDDPPASR